MSYALGAAMAKSKSDNEAQMVMSPVSLAKQLMPGTLEFAIHERLQRRIDTSIFARTYHHDETGCAAYDPQILRKVVLFAYSRGMLSSREIEPACRENITFMALACGLVPDHSTIVAFSSSMKAEIQSIFSDLLLICAEEDLLGGTHLSLDGLKLSSNASKEWSGTFAD
jgi:transposase